MKTTRQKLNILGFLLLSLTTIIQTLLIIMQSSEMLHGGETGTGIFYGLQLFGNMETPWHLLIFQSLNFLILFWLAIYVKNTAMFSMILTRKSYKQVINATLKKIFFGAFILRISQALIELLLLNFLFAPTKLLSHSDFLINGMPAIFSSNGITNLLLYLILSAIGWGITAMLLFALSLYIKKTTLILPMVLLVNLVLVVLPGMLNLLTAGKLSPIFYLIFLPLITSPGEINFGTPTMPYNLLLMYTATATLCLIGTYILISKWIALSKRGKL